MNTNQKSNGLQIGARVSVEDLMVGLFFMPEFLEEQKGTIMGTKPDEGGSGETFYVIKFDNVNTATNHDRASGVKSDKNDLVCFPAEVITVIESGSGGTIENV